MTHFFLHVLLFKLFFSGILKATQFNITVFNTNFYYFLSNSTHFQDNLNQNELRKFSNQSRLFQELFSFFPSQVWLTRFQDKISRPEMSLNYYNFMLLFEFTFMLNQMAIHYSLNYIKFIIIRSFRFFRASKPFDL